MTSSFPDDDSRVELKLCLSRKIKWVFTPAGDEYQISWRLANEPIIDDSKIDAKFMDGFIVNSFRSSGKNKLTQVLY
jgi:hypothetical protein